MKQAPPTLTKGELKSWSMYYRNVHNVHEEVLYLAKRQTNDKLQLGQLEIVFAKYRDIVHTFCN